MRYGNDLQGIIFMGKEGMNTIGTSHILMQCTGLSDKKGKEIHCGDIIENGSGNIYVMEIILSAWGYKFVGKKIGYKNKYATFDDEIKVIGNIYEDNNLLK